MEFALVLPVLLVLLFGIIQYGTIFLVRNQMTEAASDAARYAATQTASAVAANTETVLQSDVKNDGSGLLPACNGAYLTCGAPTITPSGVGSCTAPTGYECVTVSVTYSYSKDPVVAFPLLPNPSSLSASSTVIIASN